MLLFIYRKEHPKFSRIMPPLFNGILRGYVKYNCGRVVKNIPDENDTRKDIFIEGTSSEKMCNTLPAKNIEESKFFIE
jgi:hypothetical protein